MHDRKLIAGADAVEGRVHAAQDVAVFPVCALSQSCNACINEGGGSDDGSLLVVSQGNTARASDCETQASPIWSCPGALHRHE